MAKSLMIPLGDLWSTSGSILDLHLGWHSTDTQSKSRLTPSHKLINYQLMLMSLLTVGGVFIKCWSSVDQDVNWVLTKYW